MFFADNHQFFLDIIIFLLIINLLIKLISLRKNSKPVKWRQCQNPRIFRQAQIKGGKHIGTDESF